MSTRVLASITGAWVALVLGCGGSGVDGPASGADESATVEGVSGDGDASTGDGDGDASTGDGDADASTGDGDADASTGDGDGDASTGDGDGDVGSCEKIDFLFVVDNSISMLPEQEALTAVIPGFLAAIDSSLTTDDHILVTDTDAAGWCTDASCAEPNVLHPTCEGPDSYACMVEQFTACDRTLGAGVVNPAGEGASNSSCDPFGGNRYIVEDEPDKAGTLACMAKVGLAGFPSERPIDAMVAAVSEPLTGPGGCNQGFLRDDAILVVIFVSDDDGNNEVNTPQQAFDALLAAKGNDLDRIVMLGLAPFEANNCSLTPGAGDHWLELIAMFGAQGLHGPSCADDFGPDFDSLVDVIVEACQANPS